MRFLGKEERTRSQKLYSVYDSVAEVWGKPFPMKNKGEAIRGFSQAVNDPQTNLYLHPEDYTLFEIGEWNDDAGTITMYDAKLSCGVAIEYRQNITPINNDSQSLESIQGGKERVELEKGETNHVQ